jgi:AcrR family transcriptional regulator
MPGSAHESTATPAEDERDRGERRIRGRTLAERRLERREAMLAAGLDLFGTRGYADTTVEEVCRRAYVSSRNFYEEFDNRLDLLVAVGERIVAGAFAAWSAMAAAGDPPGGPSLRRRVSALVHALVEDPRVARVAFVETVGISPAHEARRRDALAVFPAWAEAWLEGHAGDRLDARSRRRLAVGLFGAAHELIADWALRPADERGTLDELVDDVVAVGGALLRSGTTPAD